MRQFRSFDNKVRLLATKLVKMGWTYVPLDRHWGANNIATEWLYENVGSCVPRKSLSSVIAHRESDWEVIIGAGKCHFLIKDRQKALMFKLTFGGSIADN